MASLVSRSEIRRRLHTATGASVTQGAVDAVAEMLELYFQGLIEVAKIRRARENHARDIHRANRGVLKVRADHLGFAWR